MRRECFHAEAGAAIVSNDIHLSARLRKVRRVSGSLGTDMMNKPLWVTILALFFACPMPGQSSRGSLVIWIVSSHADYVVIGSESRTQRPEQGETDDRSCKIISLGGDTLFYETGISEMSVGRQTQWSSERTARRVYAELDNHNALRLATYWRNRAVQWFSQLSEQALRASANHLTGDLVTGGFIHFDKNGRLSLRTANLTFALTDRTVRAETSDTAPGHIGVAGLATDLVREFFAGETGRAQRSAASAGGVGQIGTNSERDARLVRAAIQFAIDHARGAERSALGGDIDLAVISKTGKIRWYARKSWCNREDL